jgi:hypothetical protein
LICPKNLYFNVRFLQFFTGDKLIFRVTLKALMEQSAQNSSNGTPE